MLLTLSWLDCWNRAWKLRHCMAAWTNFASKFHPNHELLSSCFIIHDKRQQYNLVFQHQAQIKQTNDHAYQFDLCVQAAHRGFHSLLGFWG